ncbi:MAG TPA: hypothetical protein VK579_14695 [Terriglobales bacterium]|nr:hypothetical protein [Terriglobales bacterium]
MAHASARILRGMGFALTGDGRLTLSRLPGKTAGEDGADEAQACHVLLLLLFPLFDFDGMAIRVTKPEGLK